MIPGEKPPVFCHVFGMAGEGDFLMPEFLIKPFFADSRKCDCLVRFQLLVMIDKLIMKLFHRRTPDNPSLSRTIIYVGTPPPIGTLCNGIRMIQDVSFTFSSHICSYYFLFLHHSISIEVAQLFLLLQKI